MTLGQKLKALLKDNGMTQEDLAERLEVSRQAVGKWVNDKGIPEVGKLVQISRLFGVSLDYLLKEECGEKTAAEEAAVTDSGYYVSQEMLDGYLSYSRQNVMRITAGISLFILSNVFDCFGQEYMLLTSLYWLTMIIGISIMIWQYFQTRQYEEIKTQRLVFDEQVFRTFQKQRENRRKKYTVMIIAGVVILIAGSEIGYFIITAFGQTAGNVFEWIADTVWIALILWARMSMHIDNTIMRNTARTPKGGLAARYRWLYAALPVTAAAVLIGLLSNAWSPYAPLLILFCCLLVTTCKLLIENKEGEE